MTLIDDLTSALDLLAARQELISLGLLEYCEECETDHVTELAFAVASGVLDSVAAYLDEKAEDDEELSLSDRWDLFRDREAVITASVILDDTKESYLRG